MRQKEKHVAKIVPCTVKEWLDVTQVQPGLCPGVTEGNWVWCEFTLILDVVKPYSRCTDKEVVIKELGLHYNMSTEK